MRRAAMPTFNSAVPIDEQSRINFAFIKKLWGPGGEAVRNELFDQPSQKAIHDVLRAKHSLDILDDVKIIMVDIESARTTSFSEKINAKVDKTYYLVLPPKPTKSTDSGYIAMQTGLEAYFHAANDGWGL
jgi:hypothetical protein